MEKTLGQISFEAQREWIREKFPQLINPNFDKVEWESLPALSRNQYEAGACAVATEMLARLLKQVQYVSLEFEKQFKDAVHQD